MTAIMTNDGRNLDAVARTAKCVRENAERSKRESVEDDVELLRSRLFDLDKVFAEELGVDSVGLEIEVVSHRGGDTYCRVTSRDLLDVAGPLGAGMFKAIRIDMNMWRSKVSADSAVADGWGGRPHVYYDHVGGGHNGTEVFWQYVGVPDAGDVVVGPRLT